MNERIKELALQAGCSIDGMGYGEGNVEKFAELIVRECVDIAKLHVMNISTYADAEFIEEQITKHFGVEE